MNKTITTTITFEEIKTTKKDWEDAACQNCNDDLWMPNEKRYAYVYENTINARLQLCYDCFKRVI